ncbi:hypothetical protein L593_00355 [Salinarchaeum sp. Harcht-Bsk1]|uniref:TVP38/TMEM64 family protein n=1 Tax=Salinarchaeum sp. Harcht-Bsk1 TaxID=1333523 RepID=UPI0003423972|nr:TVP38/TMEM64 family protein [Salinarchaeum sp. Harcht-Bsk1]AGN00026.1 hypothetical protein L593_00355 [Salinarchaeum sp. Harcht-Bsk1]
MAPSRPPQVFRSGTARRRFLFHAVIATVAALSAFVVIVDRYQFLLDPIQARGFVSDFGVFAPLALVLLQALQVVAAPIPGQVLAVVAGYLFGPWWGTLYNMTGIMIGSTVAFWLSRRFGRSYVEAMVHPDLIETFDDIEEDNVMAALFVLFLVPGMPDDVLCFVGGLTDVRLRKLVLVALVGRTPAFFVVNVLGDQLGAGEIGIATGLAIAMLVVSGLGYIYRGRVLSWLEQKDLSP